MMMFMSLVGQSGGEVIKMIIKRKDPMTLFADMEPHTVFGFDGSYCIKLAAPVSVRIKSSSGEFCTQAFHAFDLQQSSLRVMKGSDKGFIIKGAFVEGAT